MSGYMSLRADISAPQHIEIDITDHISSVDVTIDYDDIAGNIDVDDFLDELDLSEVISWVEGQDAEDVASYVSTEYMTSLVNHMPDLQRLVLGSEVVPTPTETPHEEVLGWAKALRLGHSQIPARRNRMPEIRADISKGMDAIVRNPELLGMMYAAITKFHAEKEARNAG